MGFDSIANASIPSAPNSKDFGKKKRANRSAKLKQCKFDARREQWLSQGAIKNKGCKTESNCVSSLVLENLEMRGRKTENERSIHHEYNSEWPSNSPTSQIGSVLCANDSGMNYFGSSSISSSSGGCYSGSITEEEEGDDGCLDDWEAVADALAFNDKKENHQSEIPDERKPITGMEESHGETDGASIVVADMKPDCKRTVPRVPVNNTRAWRPDDDFRPQSLPNLSKQHSLPNLGRQYDRGGVPWASDNVISTPSSCPICIEDLDPTDSRFLPCLCGFRLCLFCHKRILEDDGRCPGCRKPYAHDPGEAEASIHGGSMTFRLARSCSMITRS